MAKKTYNPKNANSILKHGEKLLGHSLRELHPEAIAPHGKGGLGEAVEEFHYGYKPNSVAERVCHKSVTHPFFVCFCIF